MSRIRVLRERWKIWQTRRKAKWTLTIALLLLASVGCGPLVWSSFQHAALLKRIEVQLAEANSVSRTPTAIQLLEQGTITVDGRTLGNARIQAVAPQLFDEQGRILDASAVASIIATTVAPTWAPVSFVERPWMVTLIFAIGISLGVLAVWLELFGVMVQTFGAGALAMIPFWAAGKLEPMVAIGSIAVLFFAFHLLTRTALALLSRGSPLVGVAHTLLLEGIRQRISLGFIGTLLVVLPCIPLFIDAREPLRYQVQTFLARGTGLVFTFAAFLTIFLGCATVAFEMRDRQIWTVLTKPVSRLNYLLGKFVGLAILNAILLLVAGTAVFAYVEFLRTRQAVDVADAAALRDQVLVAREVAIPEYTMIEDDRVRDMVDRTIQQDSLLRADIAEGRRSEAEVRRELTNTKQKEFLAQQRTIEPGKSRKYQFVGLSEARRSGADPVLRYRFHIGRDDSHEVFPALFVFGSTPPAMVNFVPVQRNVFAIPASAITEDGTLQVEVVNGGLTQDMQFYPGQWSMNFDLEGLEVLHRVGGFEGNYFKAMLVDWSKLVFLGALGVAAGSFLSFPVAVLLAFTVFMAGALSPFLGMALGNYYIHEESDLATKLFQYAVRGVASFVQIALAPFAQSGATADLVDGQVITWWDVWKTFWRVGLAWSGASFILGYLAFRRKEIAIYSGNG